MTFLRRPIYNHTQNYQVNQYKSYVFDVNVT